MRDDGTGIVAKGAEACAPGDVPGDFAECVARGTPGERQAKGPTAAQPENPYHRIFTRTPSLEALARRAYEAKKRDAGQPAEENLGKNEKKALHDG